MVSVWHLQAFARFAMSIRPLRAAVAEELPLR